MKTFLVSETLDSGFGWRHEQRPNKNRMHILAYSMESKEFDNHYYGKNIFNNLKNTMIWYTDVRLPEAHLDNNTYIQKTRDYQHLPLFIWEKDNVP
jgi:hypothetical protein